MQFLFFLTLELFCMSSAGATKRKRVLEFGRVQKVEPFQSWSFPKATRSLNDLDLDLLWGTSMSMSLSMPDTSSDFLLHTKAPIPLHSMQPHAEPSHVPIVDPSGTIAPSVPAQWTYAPAFPMTPFPSQQPSVSTSAVATPSPNSASPDGAPSLLPSSAFSPSRAPQFSDKPSSSGTALPAGPFYGTPHPSAATWPTPMPTSYGTTSSHLPWATHLPSGEPSLSKTLSPTEISSFQTHAPSWFPTSAPTSVPTSKPTVAPGFTTQPPMSFAPSYPTPSPSEKPNRLPTSAPAVTVSSQPTISAPTFLPTPLPYKVVFTCGSNGVDLADAPYHITTVVDIKVGYLVETLAFLDMFEQDLEQKILAAATAGALQCDEGGPLFGQGGNPPSVDITTSLIGGNCTPAIAGSVCIVLETQLQILVDQDLEPDLAAFLSYVLLQAEMDGGSFVDAVPLLNRVQYISPLPLNPPAVSPVQTVGPSEILQQKNGTVSVSPWTVGAVLLMSVGGLVALWAWASNRRTRHRRHMQLLEDLPIVAPEAAQP